MSNVKITQEGPVTVLTVDRAPANALDIETLDEICAAARELAAGTPRPVVLHGPGKCFSAGLDLKAIPGYSMAERGRLVDGVNDMVTSLYGLPMPVLAAVSGHAIAGGLVLALTADLRVGSASANYGMTEIQVAVPFPKSAIGLLKAELHDTASRRLTMIGDLLPAEEALRLGALDEVVPAEQVLPRTLEHAERLAGLSMEVYALTKSELRAAKLANLFAVATDDPLSAGFEVP
ncbi:MAG TPA: enoyl-CoA hydratase/isomerase family protein [Solirubrobacteraceae bacterium]|jgi:enoyl-CoA hydratase|nr:enoyl-CoA hydratase/isomerase family protein [Solirubrobacteraceae bacterium]